MALNFCLLSLPPCSLPRLAHRNVQPKALAKAHVAQNTECLVRTQTSDPTVVRRSANYHPTSWNYDSVQSFASDYTGETHARRRDERKEDVRRLLEEVVEPLDLLELIDDLHRLGVGYIFENEVRRALDNMSVTKSDMGTDEDLYFTALRFRVLRLHGYEVSLDVFSRFKDEREGFKAYLCEEPKGLLSLYEASYLAFEGETTLDEAREFTSRNLKCLNDNISKELAKMVTHSLEFPLHWRTERLESRWYINKYERKEAMNPSLLELAKLDYNMVQAAYQDEIKEVTRWWENLRLGAKLSFSRDRLTECFLWALAVNWDPQISWARKELTKVFQLITTVDDVYDVYGTLDELELFTDAVDRWDVNAMEGLPEYMKLCFLALYNTINEMGYNILEMQGRDVIPYLKKMWADLCKAYLVEAKWYNEGYKPSLDEYLNNGWVSIGTVAVLGQAYICGAQEITNETLDWLNNGSDLIYYSAMITRLMNDLGTSTNESQRGDISKSIQCYMHDASVSEKVARVHIKSLNSDTWKKMNKEVLSPSPIPQALKDCAINLVRISHCYYQYGDGFGVSNHETKDRLILLLAEPFTL